MFKINKTCFCFTLFTYGNLRGITHKKNKEKQSWQKRECNRAHNKTRTDIVLFF